MAYSQSASIVIEAPPDAVFAYVSDLKRHPEWSELPITVEVDGETLGPGTTFRTKGAGAAAKASAGGKVLVYEPPTRFAYEIDAVTGRTYIWTMELQPVANGTRLTHRFDQTRAQFWLKLLNPLVYRASISGAMRRGLEAIKAKVEAMQAQRAV